VADNLTGILWDFNRWSDRGLVNLSHDGRSQNKVEPVVKSFPLKTQTLLAKTQRARDKSPQLGERLKNKVQQTTGVGKLQRKRMATMAGLEDDEEEDHHH